MHPPPAATATTHDGCSWCGGGEYGGNGGDGGGGGEAGGIGGDGGDGGGGGGGDGGDDGGSGGGDEGGDGGGGEQVSSQKYLWVSTTHASFSQTLCAEPPGHSGATPLGRHNDDAHEQHLPSGHDSPHLAATPLTHDSSSRVARMDGIDDQDGCAFFTAEIIFQVYAGVSSVRARLWWSCGWSIYM